MKYALGNMLNGAGGINADQLALDLPFAVTKSLTAAKGPTPVLTRGSTGTFVGSNGLIQTAAVNAARFDHDPVTLASRGLLIEEGRTNLVFPSDTLTTQTRTVTAVAHTLSFYGTGTVVLSGVHSATVVGTGAYPSRQTLTFTPTAGSLTLTVTGTVQFAQLEAGSFATSYIPTTTSALARSADVCSITGTNFTGIYNQPEGTLFADVTPQTVDQISVVVGMNTTASTLSHFIYKINSAINASGKRWGAQTVSLAGSQTAIVTSTDVAVSRARLAYSYKLNDFAFAASGSLVGTDTSGNLPVSPTAMRIGARDDGLAINGHIAAIRYYRKRLANSKLSSITV